MISKRTIFIFGLILAISLAFIAVVIGLRSGSKTDENIPVVDTSQPIQPAQKESLAENQKVYIKTESGQVLVKNFFDRPVINIDSFGQIIYLTQNDNFVIYYNLNGNYFAIELLKQPYENARKNAEADFAEILDIDALRPCLLPVKLTVPALSDPDSPKSPNYGLSFCPGSLPLQ